MSNLTKRQYLMVLKRGRKLLDTMADCHIDAHDCTDTGHKSTTSNVGLCNDHYLCYKKELAYWPEKWPERKDLKSKKEGHLCPLDWRDKSIDDIANGCFYTCLLFAGKIKGIEHIKELYDKRIKEATNE